MGEMTDVRAGSGAEHRAARRTNLMLAATIYADGDILPVRIRNLSETGALVEGAALPEKGASLVLSRNELRVPATVAWSGGGRCGIHFDRATPVYDWTGVKVRPSEPSGYGDQRRVDALQAQARAGIAVAPAPRPAETPAAAGADAHEHFKARLADELAYVQRLLDSMGEELIGEPIIVAHHARTLQNIDIASQILAHLSTIVRADDPIAAVERIGMDDLRARLKRRPLL
jgi:hypothetical protein